MTIMKCSHNNKKCHILRLNVDDREFSLEVIYLEISK